MENKQSCDNRQPCTCRYTSCERHGKCCECVAYHRQQGDIPTCFKKK